MYCAPGPLAIVGVAELGDRDLADPDDLLDERDVVADAAGQRRHRMLERRPGQRKGGDAVLLERLGLGDQRAHVLGRGIEPQHADHGRDPGARELAGLELGRPAREAEAAAAAQHVHVIVDEARRERQPAEIELLDLEAADLDAGLGDRDDPLAGDHDVLSPQRLGRQDLGIAQDDHDAVPGLAAGGQGGNS